MYAEMLSKRETLIATSRHNTSGGGSGVQLKAEIKSGPGGSQGLLDSIHRPRDKEKQGDIADADGANGSVQAEPVSGTTRTRKQLTEEYQQNDDGKVDIAEFFVLCLFLLRSAAPRDEIPYSSADLDYRTLSQVFRLLDHSGDGALNAAELHALFESFDYKLQDRHGSQHRHRKSTVLNPMSHPAPLHPASSYTEEDRQPPTHKLSGTLAVPPSRTNERKARLLKRAAADELLAKRSKEGEGEHDHAMEVRGAMVEALKAADPPVSKDEAEEWLLNEFTGGQLDALAHTQGISSATAANQLWDSAFGQGADAEDGDGELVSEEQLERNRFQSINIDGDSQASTGSIPPPKGSEDGKTGNETRISAKVRFKGAAHAVQLSVAQWVQCYDGAHGRPYYYNTKTKQSQWTKPMEGTIQTLEDARRGVV